MPIRYLLCVLSVLLWFPSAIKASNGHRHLCAANVGQLEANALKQTHFPVETAVQEYMRYRALIGSQIIHHLAAGAPVRFGRDWYTNVTVRKLVDKRVYRSMGDRMESAANDVRQILNIEKSGKHLDRKIWLDRLAFLQASTGMSMEALEMLYIRTFDLLRKHSEYENIPFVSGPRETVTRTETETIYTFTASEETIVSPIAEELVEIKVIFGLKLEEVVDDFFKALKVSGKHTIQVAHELLYVHHMTGRSVEELAAEARLYEPSLTEWFMGRPAQQLGDYTLSNYYNAVNLLRHAACYNNGNSLAPLIADWKRTIQNKGLQRTTILPLATSSKFNVPTSILMHDYEKVRDHLRKVYREMGDTIDPSTSGLSDRSPINVEGDDEGRGIGLALEGIVVGVPSKIPFDPHQTHTEGDLLENAFSIVDACRSAGISLETGLKIHDELTRNHRKAIYLTGNDLMNAWQAMIYLYFPILVP